jgi:stage V sporulation protein G
MPSKKRKDGTFRDIAHPLNSELRASIEKKILQVYEEELKKMSSAAAENMKALGQKKRDYDDEGP